MTNEETEKNIFPKKKRPYVKVICAVIYLGHEHLNQEAFLFRIYTHSLAVCKFRTAVSNSADANRDASKLFLQPCYIATCLTKKK